jgi:hypothetical protein
VRGGVGHEPLAEGAHRLRVAGGGGDCAPEPVGLIETDSRHRVRHAHHIFLVERDPVREGEH